MLYTDIVLGDFEINDPVALDIINSSSMQRLKWIDQAGYKPLHVKPDVDSSEYNRFSHSIGVYLLLKKFGASNEEQLAGLIHDLSHSAFSHTIDYVLEDGDGSRQSYQDSIHDDFVTKSDIAKIIDEHGLKLEELLDDKRHPLKEKELPDLCADRIEYSLKSAVIFEELPIEEANKIIEELMIKDGEWVFKSLKSAEKFAKNFELMNTKYYSSFLAAVMHKTVAECIKYAIESGYLTLNDLYTTDNQVLSKIKAKLSSDEGLKTLWERMNSKELTLSSPNDFDVEVQCKSRIVDPLFLKNGKITKLSDEIPSWKQKLIEESIPKKYYLKFLSRENCKQ